MLIAMMMMIWDWYYCFNLISTSFHLITIYRRPACRTINLLNMLVKLNPQKVCCDDDDGDDIYLIYLSFTSYQCIISMYHVSIYHMHDIISIYLSHLTIIFIISMYRIHVSFIYVSHAWHHIYLSCLSITTILLFTLSISSFISIMSIDLSTYLSHVLTSHSSITSIYSFLSHE